MCVCVCGEVYLKCFVWWHLDRDLIDIGYNKRSIQYSTAKWYASSKRTAKSPLKPHSMGNVHRDRHTKKTKQELNNKPNAPWVPPRDSRATEKDTQGLRSKKTSRLWRNFTNSRTTSRCRRYAPTTFGAEIERVQLTSAGRRCTHHQGFLQR